MSDLDNLNYCINKSTNVHCGNKSCKNNICYWENLTCCYYNKCETNYCDDGMEDSNLLLIGVFIICGIFIVFILTIKCSINNEEKNKDLNKYDNMRFSFENGMTPLY